jgi:hypothetical protein
MADLAPRLDIELSAFKAFSMTTQDKANAGYVTEWSFASGTKLEPDLSVPDPESPDKKIKVVAVLDLRQFWEGGRTKPKQIQGRVSDKNRSKLKNAMHASSGGTEQKLSMKVVRYNEEGKVYYEHFAYEGAECVFTPDAPCDVKSEACTDVPQPPNYPFNVSLTPRGSAPEHEFRCAENPTDKVVVPWGGVGAG